MVKQTSKSHRQSSDDFAHIKWPIILVGFAVRFKNIPVPFFKHFRVCCCFSHYMSQIPQAVHPISESWKSQTGAKYETATSARNNREWHGVFLSQETCVSHVLLFYESEVPPDPAVSFRKHCYFYSRYFITGNYGGRRKKVTYGGFFIIRQRWKVISSVGGIFLFSKGDSSRGIFISKTHEISRKHWGFKVKWGVK